MTRDFEPRINNMGTHNDWSSFTPEAIAPLLEQDLSGMGYLLWLKIDHECLKREDFSSLFQTATLASPDPVEQNMAKAKAEMRQTIKTLRQYGIKRVCLGVSWCDWICFRGGKAWIKTYLEEFAQHFDILPRVTFTPPPLTNGGLINSPPTDLSAYALFLEQEFFPTVGHLCGEYIELWNEFNLDTDWIRAEDPDLHKFCVMISLAACVVRTHKKKVVLGGVTNTPEMFDLFTRLARSGFFQFIDAVGYHDLRGTWSDRTPSVQITRQAALIKEALSQPIRSQERARFCESVLEVAPPQLRIIFVEQNKVSKITTPEVWLTEYGFPVADPEDRFELALLEEIQVALFAYATYAVAIGAVSRVYWYTHKDYIGESVRKHTTGWEDVLQYYYGDSDAEGNPRLLGHYLKRGGPKAVLELASERGYFPLVDAASLNRKLPTGYSGQSAA